MWNGFSLFMLSLYWAIGFLSCHYQSLSFVPINGSADAFGLFHFVINCFSFFANEAPLRPSSSPLLLNFKLKSFPWPPGAVAAVGHFSIKFWIWSKFRIWLDFLPKHISNSFVSANSYFVYLLMFLSLLYLEPVLYLLSSCLYLLIFGKIMRLVTIICRMSSKLCNLVVTDEPMKFVKKT